jgi:hypothetical protein
MQTIVVQGHTFNLVTLPTSPAPVSIEIGMNDASTANASPFTRVEQTQYWPGGDFWDATVTLPPMSRAAAAPWEAALAELRGRANVFMLGDPRAKGPIDKTILRGVPLVDSRVTGNNVAMATQLVTKGWAPSIGRLLLAGDLMQIGYRLYKVCETVASDATGAATIQIWPSLREWIPDGQAINLSNPQGLFRLASNRRTVQASITRLTTLSLPCVEAR